MAIELIKEFRGHSIRAREGDHYVNATELCKASGKKWSHYYENKGTKGFLEALSRSAGIPADPLVQIKNDGPNEGRGTWIHPRVVIHFAQWASAEFAAAVTGWVLELITTGSVALPTSPVLLDPDPIIDGLMRHQNAFGLIIETRRRQVEMEQAQASMVLSLAEAMRAVAAVNTTASAALHQSTSNHGHFTVLGYSRLHGREMPLAVAASHGKALSQICANRKIATGEMTDPRFGKVNTYPESLLREYFGDSAA